MNDLFKRSLSGVVFVTVIIGGTIIHPFVFASVFAIILLLTQAEFYKIAEQANFSPQKVVGSVLALFLFTSSFLVANNFIPKAFVLLNIPLLLFIFINELFRKKGGCLKNIAITITGILYIAVPFSLLNFIVVISSLGNTVFYPWILVGIFLILWTNDSMAYVLGSLLGKHKIAANISPGKSWEGFIGGTVFAVIIGIINAVLFQEINMTNWIIIALLVVIFGTLGDFFESKLKREIGIKDSGTILPGHGGLLDRFDSLLFAIPVVFIWLILIDKF